MRRLNEAGYECGLVMTVCLRICGFFPEKSGIAFHSETAKKLRPVLNDSIRASFSLENSLPSCGRLATPFSRAIKYRMAPGASFITTCLRLETLPVFSRCWSSLLLTATSAIAAIWTHLLVREGRIVRDLESVKAWGNYFSGAAAIRRSGWRKLGTKFQSVNYLIDT